MNKNIPPIPEYKAKDVIAAIEKDFIIDEDEKQEIEEFVSNHSCEFSAIVERVSNLLQIDYYRIKQLLYHL